MTAQKTSECPWCQEFAELEFGIFGGGDSGSFGAWRVACSECSATGPRVHGGSKDKAARHLAVKLWNQVAVRKVQPNVSA